ncbi:MAG: L-serine ammonia-lyase, iron-sulfur-dependent subunit beta [Oscillospiraceae bacterium]|nr:L-serine ammonia-lyase, iron-sulfur-dependent subunit beta [Oscillospiraceae bacterium]
MSIFEIIGPVMVGPSSSHTAGAARIGAIAREFLNEEPKELKIYFHGSFSSTYKGHGSDKAVIGGLLGFKIDDIRIKRSLELAKELGIEFSFSRISLPDAHPNTILIEAVGINGKKISIQGASLGGGVISINKLNDIEVDFGGDYDTLIVEHTDVSGATANVTNFLAARGINIASMKVFRASKGGKSNMIIETDGRIDDDIPEQISKIRYIQSALVISKIY